MIKIFIFQLFVVLLVVNGVALSMHTTKALRVISSSKFNRSIRINSQASFDQWLASGGGTKEERIDSLASIEKILKSIEKRLESHNKFLQAHCEFKKIEMELQIYNSSMHSSVRAELRRKLNEINIPE